MNNIKYYLKHYYYNKIKDTNFNIKKISILLIYKYNVLSI